MRRPRVRLDRTVQAICVIAVVGLLLRLGGLGTRPFHWDEARVGYWTLRYLDSGAYSYRPVAGGPLLYHLNEFLLPLIGTTDATARLSVAIVGALTPFCALLFRDRLREDETIAIAFVLAFTPLLLYYSRFLRGDLPAAIFMLTTVGFVVRAIDRSDHRYLYAASVSLVAALSASAFAVVHLLCLAVVLVLTFDHRRVRGNRARTVLSDLRAGVTTIQNWGTPLARTFFVFLGTWALLFAPRGTDWTSLDGIERLLAGTFIEPISLFRAVRVANHDGHEFLPYMTDAAGTLLAVSLPVVLLAVAGFVADRYGVFSSNGARSIVTLTGLWALFGFLLFPTLSEVSAPWVLVHIIVPLTIPAGIGLAALVRYGSHGAHTQNPAPVAIVALLLVSGGVVAGATIADAVYGEQTAENDLSQYAQPTDDLEAIVTAASAVPSEGDSPTTIYVGEQFVMETEPIQPPIQGAENRAAFAERLPIVWYTERLGGTTESVATPADITGSPSVVVAAPEHRSELDDQLQAYDATTYQTGLWDREVVVYVRHQ